MLTPIDGEGDNIKTNELLYGKGVVVPPIPHELANERIKLSVHYMNQDKATMNEVFKAIQFWTKLRDEDGI